MQNTFNGDIGWEFWCKEGDALPERTVTLLKDVDAALFEQSLPSLLKQRRQSLCRNCNRKVWSIDLPSFACGRCLICIIVCGHAKHIPEIL